MSGVLTGAHCPKQPMPDVGELQQQLDRLEKRMAELQTEMSDMKAAWTVFMHLMADHLHNRKVTDEQDD